jgi:hypothetical protein
MIWDRTRQVLRLRSALRDFFPAALEAFDDLSAADTLELLGRAPDPCRPAGRVPQAGRCIVVRHGQSMSDRTKQETAVDAFIPACR